MSAGIDEDVRGFVGDGNLWAAIAPLDGDIVKRPGDIAVAADKHDRTARLVAESAVAAG